MDVVNVKLLGELRKHAPVSVRAYDAQDAVREIAVPTRRKRWSQVVETVEARPWVRVELLGKGGGVLGYVTNEGPAEELEDISGASGAGGPIANQVRWILDLLLKAQTSALTFRDKEHNTLLSTMDELMQVQTGAVRGLVEIMAAQRDEGMRLAETRAAADQTGDLEQVVKLLESTPQAMAALGPLLGTVLGLLGGRKALPAPQRPPPPPPPPAPAAPPPPPPPAKPKRRA